MAVVIKEPPIELDAFTVAQRRGMTAEEFAQYVGGLEGEKPKALFLHHTWKPTPETWRGMATVLAMKAYYETQMWRDGQGREHEGWTAGPHVFVAPDGIWLFSDLRYDGVGVAGHNRGSRHVEMVGNYDQGRPEGEVLRLTVVVLATLSKWIGLTPEQILFHRDYASKTCPGMAVSKEWVQGLVKGYLLHD